MCAKLVFWLTKTHIQNICCLRLGLCPRIIQEYLPVPGIGIYTHLDGLLSYKGTRVSSWRRPLSADQYFDSRINGSYSIAGSDYSRQLSWLSIDNVSLKGKWQQKFLLSYLKESLKIIYRSLLQNFYICFTLGDIVTWIIELSAILD